MEKRGNTSLPVTLYLSLMRVPGTSEAGVKPGGAQKLPKVQPGAGSRLVASLFSRFKSRRGMNDLLNKGGEGFPINSLVVRYCSNLDIFNREKTDEVDFGPHALLARGLFLHSIFKCLYDVKR